MSRPNERSGREDESVSADTCDTRSPTAALDSPPASLEELDEAIPEISGYELGEPLGAGGMGVVYAATQRVPIERRVALKVIRHAAISLDFLRRFEAERQALALMDHSGIAKIYDAGKTTDGRPYYSMQRVEGVKLTAYCDSHGLTPRARVQLFKKLCQAVQHAHNKGVVHRDLKPSNILVGEADDQATPHVIDFGIAKAVSGRLSQESLETQYGFAVGTPAYMSPEQVGASGLDVDTRTDVYSLGVILYELLVGRLPYEEGAVSRPDFLARHGLGEVELVTPTQQLSTLGDATREVAARRGTDAAALRRVLKGDLEWIVMKALEVDRERRYATVHDLALDLERCLKDEPVQARPPNVGYQARKFVKRHKLGVAAAAVLLAALVAGTVGTSVGLVRARRAEQLALKEAETSKRVSEFLADMMGAVDPMRAGGALLRDLEERVVAATRQREENEEEALTRFQTAMRGVSPTDAGLRLLDEEVLARAGATIESELKGEPILACQLERTVGTTYRRLGLYDQANEHAQRSVDHCQAALGREHEETLRSVGALGEVYLVQGAFEKAEELFAELVAVQSRVLGSGHAETLSSRGQLASAVRKQSRFEEAAKVCGQALEEAQASLGGEHAVTLAIKQIWSCCLEDVGSVTESVTVQREVTEARRRVLGERAPETMEAMVDLAMALANERKLAEALAVAKEVHELQRETLGTEHGETLKAAFLVGSLMANWGQYSRAEPLLRSAVETQRRVLGENHPDTLESSRWLALTLLDQSKLTEGETLARTTLELAGARKDSFLAFVIKEVLAQALRHRGRLGEAERLFREGLSAAQKVSREGSLDVLVPLLNIAELNLEGERFSAAEELSRRVTRLGEKHHGLEDQFMLDARGILGWSISDTDLLKATRMLEDVVAPVRDTLGEQGLDVVKNCIRRLAQAYLRQNRFFEAESLLRETLRALDGREGELPYLLQAELALALLGQGRVKEAETLLSGKLAEARQALPEHYFIVGMFRHYLADCALVSGREQEALAMLGQAIDEGWARPSHLLADPFLRPLRDEPGFERLVERARTELESRWQTP